MKIQLSLKKAPFTFVNGAFCINNYFMGLSTKAQLISVKHADAA